MTSGGALRDIRLGGLFTMLSPMQATLQAKFDNVSGKLNEIEQNLANNLEGCNFLSKLTDVAGLTMTKFVIWQRRTSPR